MKTRPRLLAAIAALFLSLSAGAAPGGSPHTHGEKPEWAELFGDAPLPLVWQSASAAADATTQALADKKLDGVPAWAETIHLAAHALIDQVEITDAEKKKRLVAALDQAARIADEVLDASEHKEPERAAAEFRRLTSALSLAKTRLPKEITSAPRTTAPRVAKPPAHEEHGHAH
jgi:hypothetical protein